MPTNHNALEIHRTPSLADVGLRVVLAALVGLVFGGVLSPFATPLPMTQPEFVALCTGVAAGKRFAWELLHLYYPAMT